MKSIKDASIAGKDLILRVDFNITLDNNGKIIDNIKIKSSIPTILYLLSKKPKRIIIVTHFGRPIIRTKEKIKNIILGNKNLEIYPIVDELAKLLKIKISKKIVPEYEDNFSLPFYKLSDQIWVMENVRFDEREENNDKVFSYELAKLGDIYVTDAFGNSHRNHASMVGIMDYLPGYAGILMEKELTHLSILLRKPPKPFVLILGGAKVSDKIMILKNLVKKADRILLGGVMANTFLVGRSIDMKSSLYDRKCVDLASDLYSSAAGKFFLPTDLVWRGRSAVDIGKSTIREYENIIYEAKTIFWNGTMGLTSMGNYKYSFGTWAIVKAVADSKAETKIICGGDTIAEVNKLKLINKITHVSTGGGASLSFLAGKNMPAIDKLNSNDGSKPIK